MQSSPSRAYEDIGSRVVELVEAAASFGSAGGRRDQGVIGRTEGSACRSKPGADRAADSRPETASADWRAGHHRRVDWGAAGDAEDGDLHSSSDSSSTNEIWRRTLIVLNDVSRFASEGGPNVSTLPVERLTRSDEAEEPDSLVLISASKPCMAQVASISPSSAPKLVPSGRFMGSGLSGGDSGREMRGALGGRGSDWHGRQRLWKVVASSVVGAEAGGSGGCVGAAGCGGG
eukprot:CAMPEP_0181205348 /NCGR_PEP_ID=MMETSP1096-20121128/20427_1 /TAXON_ID=156174 ORGANISM="Chrysochromulina ericina, Strain CCMP281" /NCGR_SAMPLE_ID=MMETSP1096 /ASSEMBLY_ACC=CAM_ASM_000453 /LENGTH=231 /DNA_ID=CAMNT_0023296121 /DNA_START=405 /DNA_END=1098 /DNA_ORIENTATION=-